MVRGARAGASIPSGVRVQNRGSRHLPAPVAAAGVEKVPVF